MNHTYTLWGALILAAANTNNMLCVTPSAARDLVSLRSTSPSQETSTSPKERLWEPYIRPALYLLMASGTITALYQNRDMVAEMVDTAIANKATTLTILIALITTIE